ncbi:hypothetical protein F5I97DRAFT_1801378 [Phlebopus sp. FC_14]|nr:hypothetical protein F5I97DRAFT_1801378 [Phlebopus sp. FC_14]
MLFKFSKSDILNSSLVYPETGVPGYTILTRSHYIRASGKDSDTESEDEAAEIRRTFIFNKSRVCVAEIEWKGRRPVDITIGKERIGAKGIFGCQGAILSDNVLGIPTRFDTEFYWMAAPDGLTLLEYDSNQTRGHFHVNCLRVGDRFITTPISGLGHDYLEFDSHPLASTEELIVTFLLMEILRRGRFDHNASPKRWPSHSLANLSKRLRRSTI